MRTYYFDTCIYGDMADGTIPEADLERLRLAIYTKRLRIISSMTLMDELVAGIVKGHPHSQKSVSFAKEFCSEQGVLMHKDILKDEMDSAISGRRLTSIFMQTGCEDESQYQDLWKSLSTPSQEMKRKMVSWSATESVRLERFRVQMKGVKDGYLKLRAGKAPTFASYREFEYSKLGSLPLGSAENALEQAGHSAKKAEVLLALRRQLPAFRMVVESGLSYGFALVINQTSTQATFGQDLIHAIYASRTRGLVTSDGQFRQIIRLIPRSERCAVWNWKEFANSLGA